MGLRNEQCEKVCRIIDDVLANRPTERDSLIVAAQKAFKSLERLESASPNSSESPNGWIPCTKKKHPDKDMFCHVTVIDDDGDYIVDDDDWDVDSESWDEYSDDEIIAWMPEIQPYQPKEDES